MSKIIPNQAILRAPFQPQAPGDTEIKKYAINLSLNENAFPPSVAAIKAYEKECKTLHRYPDRSCAKLRKVLGKKFNLDDTRIVCSNGSEEILKYVAQAYIADGDEAIYPKYGFLMYKVVILKSGGIPVPVAHDDFVISVDNILAAVTERTRVVFVDNPGNPTGTYLPYSEIKRLRKYLPEHILLVLDCAYADFVTNDDFDCGFDLVDEHENVIVTRTLSKLYGLSALRIGWSYMTKDMAEIMLRLKGGFNVNAPAQISGVAAIEDENHANMVRIYTQKWIALLTDEMVKLGLKVTPSVCNFILIHFPDGKEAKQSADKFLKLQDILVGSVDFYQLPASMRITVGTEDENNALIKAMKNHFK